MNKRRTERKWQLRSAAGKRLAVVFSVIALWCSALSVPKVATAQDIESAEVDAEYLSGLRRRQLFALAESYCLRVLERDDLSLKRQADIVVQLSQTLASQAMQTRGNQGDDLWGRASNTAQQFGEQNANSPWSTVVRAQAVMVQLDRGIWTRQRAEVAGNNPRLIEEAKSYLRDALDEIKELTPDLLEALSNRGRNIDPTIPSREQLLALQKNLRFQTARAYMQQGLCYEPKSLDHESALISAAQILDELAKLQTVDPLAWQARLESIKCYRLRGLSRLAQRRLDSLLVEDPPPQVVLDARAEQVRIHLASHDLAAALNVFQQVIELLVRRFAELDYALLETSLAQWQAHKAANSDEVEDWQNRAIEAVKRIQRYYDPYWGLRAQTLLASSVTGAALTGDMAMLAGNAQALLQQGQIDEALNLFDQAVAAAETAGQPEEAFQLAHKAAVVQHERLEYADALRRCREVSMKYTGNAESPDAHMLAIHNAAQIARETSPPDLTAYVELLVEHQTTWPMHETTGQAVWALARVYEHRQEWAQAAQTYLEIPPQDSNALPGILAAARVHRQWLSSRRAGGEDVDQPARQAAAVFENILFGSGENPTWPERWSPAQREAALAAVELRLLFTQDPYARCISILERALRDNSIAPDEWRVRLKSSYVWALVGSANTENNNLQLAQQMVDSLADAQPSSVITLLAGLDDVAQRLPREKRREIGELQLAAGGPVYERVRRKELDLAEEELQQLRILLAAATAAAGNLAYAIAHYEQLHEQYPRNGDILEAYAQTLLDAGSTEKLPDALGLWRKIERGSKAGSPRWFRAKYGLAATHEGLGNKDQAAKIILVTQALHPELGNPELKQQFEALLKRCKNRP
ncbi:MAG: hypothetical protein MPJ50_08865 [Pirellulales bacterium]|nr:hypothetical protein [Pirellulales bacterium]